MPMDQAFAGRSFAIDEPYLVGVEKIREFATAIGDDNALYHDRVAARAAGHPDLVAPPTFAVAVVAKAQDAVLFHPELGLDFSRVVHGEQRFTYHRALHAGDELSCTVHIDSIRMAAGNDIIALRTEEVDASGDPVLTANSTLVSRAA